MNEITRRPEQSVEFFSYVNQYINKFTFLNSPRVLDIKLKESSPSAVKAVSQQPVINDEIRAMAETIRSRTNLPRFEIDPLTEKPKPGSGIEIVIAAILEMPPTVYVDDSEDPAKILKKAIRPPLKENQRIKIIPSSEGDIKLARTETLNLDIKFPSGKQLNIFLDKCKTFLKSPEIIMDGFGTTKEGHKQRRNYEIAIKAALDFIGSDWSYMFHTIWDNHRITKNSQTGVFLGYDNLISSLEATRSTEKPNLILPIIGPLQEQMKLAKKMYWKEDNIIESAKILTKIARQTIEEFDLTKFSEEKIIAIEKSDYRTPPEYITEFLLNLYEKLFKDSTIFEPSAKYFLVGINEKLPDKDYEKIFPFLKAIIEYDEMDFAIIFNKIEGLDVNEIKPKTDDANLKALQYAVEKIFLHAKEVPENSGNPTRQELPTDEQVTKARRITSELYEPIQVDPKLLNKALLILDQVTSEIIKGDLNEDSLLSKIFFRHAIYSSKEKQITPSIPLTLEYLKEMQLPTP